jgi:nucleoside-diphosphate-sugar epimerase
LNDEWKKLTFLFWKYGPHGKDFVKEVGDMLCEGSMVYVGNGNSSAGLIYVNNLAKGIIKAAESNNTIGKAYNVSQQYY